MGGALAAQSISEPMRVRPGGGISYENPEGSSLRWRHAHAPVSRNGVPLFTGSEVIPAVMSFIAATRNHQLLLRLSAYLYASLS